MLAHINALAERAAGFVWRHPTDFGRLSGAELIDDPATVINLSVWRTYEHLHAFTYRSAHAAFVRRRSQWFTQLPQPTTALWWVLAGTRPTPAEAAARLRVLRRTAPPRRPSRSAAASPRMDNLHQDAAAAQAANPPEAPRRLHWRGLRRLERGARRCRRSAAEVRVPAGRGVAMTSRAGGRPRRLHPGDRAGSGMPPQ